MKKATARTSSECWQVHPFSESAFRIPKSAIGRRYGWVPEPEQLKAREDRQRQQVEQRSITDMEAHHAVPNTKLKRRSYFYLRATDAPATASEYVDAHGSEPAYSRNPNYCAAPV